MKQNLDVITAYAIMIGFNNFGRIFQSWSMALSILIYV